MAICISLPSLGFVRVSLGFKLGLSLADKTLTPYSKIFGQCRRSRPKHFNPFIVQFVQSFGIGLFPTLDRNILIR